MGQIRKLAVSMPPRHLKSICATVAFPVWVWLKNPMNQMMFASYSDRLSYRHSRDRRTLILSPWFQTAWSDRFTLLEDDNQVQKFTNSSRGHMMATSVGGSATGEGFDIGIIDDPVNPMEALSDTVREKANDWHGQTWVSRKNSKESAEIVIMQRLHEKDLIGHLESKKGKSGFEYIKIPMTAPEQTIIHFPVSGRTMVRQEGSILHPERFDKAAVAELKEDVGPIMYPAQYDQDPRPGEGGMFKRSWWRRYDELPLDIIRVRQYWDCAEEPGITNDWTVCATIAQTPIGFFWLDLWRERVPWTQLQNAALDQYSKWNELTRVGVEKVLVEKKSAGTQLIQYLENKTTLPVAKFDPGKRSKTVRAGAATPTVAAGNCYLPNNAPWVEDFIKRHEKFPIVDYDDEVDTTSMGLEDFRLDGGSSARVLDF